MSRLKSGVLVLGFLPLVLASAAAGEASAQSEHQQILKKFDTVPPSWSRIIAADQRFAPALAGSAAILDKETGLVWEKSPSIVATTWHNAVHACQDKSVGNRKGWHVPTVEELASLVAPSQTGPALPPGHPFAIDDNRSIYWTVTPNVSTAGEMWLVNFFDGSVITAPRSFGLYVWCVRGGQSLPVPF